MPAWFFIGGSIFLAGCYLLQMWLLSRKKLSGWVVSIASVVPTLPYDWLTRQYGYTIPTLISVVISVRGYRAWSAERAPKFDFAEDHDALGDCTCLRAWHGRLPCPPCPEHDVRKP